MDRRIFPTLSVWENLDVARKQLGPVEKSDRAYIIEKGSIPYPGTVPDLERSPEIKMRYLGIT